MSDVQLRRAGRISYREAIPGGEPTGDPVLCLHGFPESSYMWRELLPAIAARGRRAIAPDLPGFGDSPPESPNDWAALVAAVDRFVAEHELGPVALVVHDWGGLVGLRWACDEPGRATALVISDTGFFADGRWHGMAEALRTPGTGEELLEGMTRESFGQVMAAASAGFGEDAVDEYWRPASTAEDRRAVLELYRSGEFSELEAYDGCLGRLGLPTLLLWGGRDDFAPVSGAKRFQAQIPGAELVLVAGAGHFVYADAPERCIAEVTRFLAAS